MLNAKLALLILPLDKINSLLKALEVFEELHL
jgi:hypothetical protein